MFKEYYIKMQGETLKEAIDAHCGKPIDDLEVATLEAKEMADGESWEVVDDEGRVYAKSE